MERYPIFRTRDEVPNLFWRPVLQLRSLPLKSRWECTRRHPSYFTFWQLADATHLFEDPESASANELETAQQALIASRTLALSAIGISPEAAIDPSSEFSEFGELNPVWESGAVHPTSIRGLASLLVEVLPKETLNLLGVAFVEASFPDESNNENELKVPKKLQSLNKIARADEEGLDCLTPEPFVSINPWASKREVTREITDLLTQWKSELDLEEVRSRSEMHESYFEVWDMREGWNGGRYVPGTGKRFAEIASKLDRPLTTIHSQYKKAFELITGHLYCLNSFLELFGAIRFSRLFSEGKDAKHRQFVESSRRPVSEARLGMPVESIDSTPQPETYSLNELLADYDTLTSDGVSVEQAAAKLGIVDMEALNSLAEQRDFS